ncbi:hypothetical protein PC116_g32202 [Phytophthora cactorum]|nr:hypothetical protein PC116_g32202 [Phytophthora cactorum]
MDARAREGSASRLVIEQRRLATRFESLVFETAGLACHAAEGSE